MGQIIAAGAVLYLIPIFARGYYGVYVYFFPDGSMVNNVFLYLGKLFGAINGLTEGMLFMAVGGSVAWKGWERCFSAGKLKLVFCICCLGYLAELWFVYNALGYAQPRPDFTLGKSVKKDCLINCSASCFSLTSLLIAPSSLS